MAAKTDNPEHVGMHVFERANLGKAPFRCIGLEEKFITHPGGATQASGSCDYCGNGIRYCYIIRAVDGRAFKVGSDCVARTGDTGLIKSYKQLPAVRAMNREKAKMRDARVTAEWESIMADETNRAKLSTFTVSNWKNQQEPWLEYAKRAWGYCGASGRARYLKAAKQLLSQQSQAAAA
jgi:hypothetical protein